MLALGREKGVAKLQAQLDGLEAEVDAVEGRATQNAVEGGIGGTAPLRGRLRMEELMEWFELMRDEERR